MAENKKMTMADIAELAGVTKSTVSRYFNFLPILIGFSATRKFGGNPYIRQQNP